MRALSLLLLSLLCSAVSHAQEKAFIFPAAPLFTTVSGVVYPGPGGAAVINASAMLVSGDRANRLTFVNSVPLADTSYGVQASFSHTGRSFGFSAGYAGTVGASSAHGYFAGMSADLDKVLLGVGAAQYPGATGTPSLDASVTLPVMKAMALTTVFRNLASAPQPTIGLGLAMGAFQCELFVDLPPFSLPSLGNTYGAALTFGLGRWSVHAAGNYQMISSGYHYTVGLGRWISDNIQISVQYDDLQRVNAGVTLGL
jgi:hypothetical protein